VVGLIELKGDRSMPPGRQIRFALAVMCLATVVAARGRAQGASNAIDTAHWRANSGPMRHVEVAEGIAYLGGGFSSLHLPPGFFARHDPATGAFQGGGVTATAPIHAVVEDGAGGYFAGGSFSGAGGLFGLGIVHVFPNGAVDPAFNATVVATGFLPSPSVQSLRREGTTLFVAGQFTSCNGIPRNGLAALDTATGNLFAFDAAIAATPTSNPTVRGVEVVTSPGGAVAGGFDMTETLELVIGL
jgi:hypothetical protein